MSLPKRRTAIALAFAGSLACTVAGALVGTLAAAAPARAADDGHHPGHHEQHHGQNLGQNTGMADAKPAKDERQALKLNDDERSAVLAEMRVFLGSVQGIVSALAGGKPAAAAEAARPSGMGAMQGMPRSLMGKLPMEFRKLGMDTHQKFEAVALEAQGIGDATVILKQLDGILANCNGCHAGYRFIAE